MTTPIIVNEYDFYDNKIRCQAEMLTSLLSAGLETQDATEKAVFALSKLQQEVQRQISNARNDLSSIADTTATETAKLLIKKFDYANEAAHAAAVRYERAGRLLGVKTFAVITGALVAICVAAWLLLNPMLPSNNEMAFRRIQIIEMEAKAAMLAKKGVNLEWSECETGTLKRIKPCFRSDGVEYSPVDGADRHYAVPYDSNR